MTPTKRFSPALAASLTLGFGTLGAAAPRAYAQPPTTVMVASDANLLTVSGSGEVQAAPDIARLSLGVVTQNADAGEASAANAQKSAALIKAIKNAGVADKDIQTTGYNISPQYDYSTRKPGDNRPPQIVGYQVSNTVRVVVRKITDAGKVLDAGIKAGANDAGGISFDLNDDTRAKAQAEALTRAVADAKTKADTLGKAAGLTNLRVDSISESSSDDGPRPVFRSMRAMSAAPGGNETPVQAGELTVSASVVMKYRFNN